MQFATIVDPSVILSKRVVIGEGTIICAGTIVTVDISIGKHVIINLDCTLGHDDVIEDFVTIYPSVNVSGNVRVGECSEIGTGVQIIQGKKNKVEYNYRCRGSGNKEYRQTRNLCWSSCQREKI